MSRIHSLKNQVVFAGTWLLENPIRMQLVIIGVSVMAVALMMVVGMAGSTSIAGPSGGGSGGSG